MRRAFALLLIGLVLGGAIGFVTAAAYGVTLDGHNHLTDHAPADMDHSAQATEGGGDHDHSELVTAEGDEPTLMLHVMADPVSGWNLQMMTENFTFAPASSGATHVEGEGHAHIYANGVKIARAYGPWFHIANLPEGEVEISVTLNANDHRTIAVAGVPVEKTVVITNSPQ